MLSPTHHPLTENGSPKYTKVLLVLKSKMATMKTDDNSGWFYY